MVFTWCGWLWILFTQSRIRPLDAACSHSVFIRNSRQFLSFFSRYQKFTPNSSFPGANFNEFCIVFLHFFSLSSLFFLLFTKTSSAHSLSTVFAEHSVSDDRKVFFSPCRQRRRKRRKILKASVNNTQVRCKSNVLQVVFLYFSVVQPQGVGVGFFSGWMWEREKKSWLIFIHFHFFALSPRHRTVKWISFIDSQGWI